MHTTMLEDEKKIEKPGLFVKVNYISSALSILFAGLCYFAIDVKEIIPHAFLCFGLLNLINTFLLNKHKNRTLTFSITSFLALIASLTIILFSGGIQSPFIFVLAIIAFASFLKSNRSGEFHLGVVFLMVLLIFSQSIPGYIFTKNVVSAKALPLFSLLSILFSIYLLAHVFAKNITTTQNGLFRNNNDLSKKLLEKETLLKEIHHRVKNNLQTVSSLLSLQTRNTEEEAVKALLKATKDRVISMAMIHEMLYMRDDLSKIEYKTYVEELSQYLIKSIKGIENKIKLTIDIPDIKLGIDTAIPLGLLINEAVTNALKYGIVDDNEGEIHIAISKEENKEYVLEIGDNGIGFSQEINHKTTKSLGLKLIHNLTRQLKGSVIRDVSKKGTNYIIKFQEIGQQLNHAV